MWTPCRATALICRVTRTSWHGQPRFMKLSQTGVCPAMKPGPRSAWNYLNGGWTKVSHPNGTSPPGSLFLDFRVVGIHPTRVLHRLDQVFNCHHVRVVLHHRFFLFQRNVDFLHIFFF